MSPFYLATVMNQLLLWVFSSSRFKRAFLLFQLLMISGFISGLLAQALFESNVALGEIDTSWKNPNNWVILSGSSSLGYPVASDTVQILAGDSKARF